jgi:hypothetical protein
MEILRDVKIEPLGDAEGDFEGEGTFTTFVPTLPDDVTRVQFFAPHPADADDVGQPSEDFSSFVRAVVEALRRRQV